LKGQETTHIRTGRRDKDNQCGAADRGRTCDLPDFNRALFLH
jgi:hypothetical protein